jgi:hypothetical protein
MRNEIEHLVRNIRRLFDSMVDPESFLKLIADPNQLGFLY